MGACTGEFTSAVVSPTAKPGLPMRATPGLDKDGGLPSFMHISMPQCLRVSLGNVGGDGAGVQVTHDAVNIPICLGPAGSFTCVMLGKLGYLSCVMD